MLELRTHSTGTLDVGQQLTSPAIYLDHWALLTLTKSQSMVDRFTAALRARRGSLAVSIVNIAEFGSITDTPQVTAAEEFLDSIIANLFLLEANFFVVMDREDALASGGPPSAPHADRELLRAFALNANGGILSFSARGFLTSARLPEVLASAKSLTNSIIERAAELRRNFFDDQLFEKAVRRPIQPIRHQVLTRIVLRELLKPLISNQALTLTTSHANDLLHAVVPLAYCDLVLLDKHWATQAQQLRRRLLDRGISTPIAETLSGGADAVEDLIRRLEEH